MIELSSLSDEKKSILQKFMENIKDCRHKLLDSGDEHIVKWLIARNFNLEEAEAMLRKSLEWRRINRIDTILEWYKPPEVLEKYYPAGSIGCDKKGGLVLICPVGNLDVKGLFQSVSKKDYITYVMLYLTEKCRLTQRERNKKNGANVSYMTFIADMAGGTTRDMVYKPYVEAGIESIKLLEANYPENLGRLFVINAPKFFTTIFATLKPILSEATVDKFRIYGTDENEWKPALHEFIDADQLPVHYGGTLTDPDGDPKCSSRIIQGGIIPTSYYLPTTKLVPNENMQSATIYGRGKKKLKFETTVPNSNLKWQFFSESGDIAFCVFFQSEEDTVELFPKERYECHLIMEEGRVPCECPGTYMVEFDNSYSFLRSKKIWYNITIETTQD